MCRAGTAYISAAQRIGWDQSAGHIFPVVTREGGRGSRPPSVARMIAYPASPFAAGRPAEPYNDALLSSGRLPR